MTTEGAAPSGEKHRERARRLAATLTANFAITLPCRAYDKHQCRNCAIDALEDMLANALARVEAETLELAATTVERLAMAVCECEATKPPHRLSCEAGVYDDLALSIRALTSERSEAPRG